MNPLANQWDKIKEDEPDNEEIKLVEEYKNSKENLVSLDDLVMEVDSNEE